MSAISISGDTPLHKACREVRVAVVELLIRKGANVSATVEDGKTLLHVLADMRHRNTDHSRIGKDLIDGGISVHTIDRFGETALCRAACTYDSRFVQLLLDYGADTSFCDDKGDTPLMMASVCGQNKTIDLLLNHGADVSAANKGGQTALMAASINGHIKAVELLLNHGADVSATNKSGETASQLALRRGYSSIAYQLRACSWSGLVRGYQ